MVKQKQKKKKSIWRFEWGASQTKCIYIYTSHHVERTCVYIFSFRGRVCNAQHIHIEYTVAIHNNNNQLYKSRAHNVLTYMRRRVLTFSNMENVLVGLLRETCCGFCDNTCVSKRRQTKRISGSAKNAIATAWWMKRATYVRYILSVWRQVAREC